MCYNCQKTLVEPVFLPCCHTVCRKHEIDGPILTCGLCQVKHEVPFNNGFPRNLLVQTFLDKELEKADFGPEHRAAISSLKDIKVVVDELTRLQEKPEFEIQLVSNELKNKIESNKESAKQAKDIEANDLLVKLKNVEDRCIASLSAVKKDLVVSDEINTLLKTLKFEDIPFWETLLTRFERNVKQYKEFHEDMVDKLGKLCEERVRLKQMIFADDLKNLRFEIDKFSNETSEPLL